LSDLFSAETWSYGPRPIKIEWEQVYLGTYASCTIDGLTIGEKYYFRVAAITADGMSEYCEPVSKVAV
jgi:hypothetical protein